MYSRNSFGSYYPIDSLIHRLNPIMKIFNFVLAIVLICLPSSIYVHIFLFSFVLIMTFMTYVPIRFYIKTIWSVRYIYILIAFFCLYFDTTLVECITYLLKFTILIEYLNILAYTTSPSESIYGIEKFLSLFNFLYLPLGRLSFRLNSILRFIPLYQSVEYKTYKACSSRGIDYFHANIFGRIYARIKTESSILRLVRNKNKEIKNFSEMRLYSDKKYRTNYRTNKISYFDIFFLLFHIGLILVYLIESGIV